MADAGATAVRAAPPMAVLSGALPAQSSACKYPIIGVAAVLVGAFIATLNTRTTTFALADIRGAKKLGFGESSPICPAENTGGRPERSSNDKRIAPRTSPSGQTGGHGCDVALIRT